MTSLTNLHGDSAFRAPPLTSPGALRRLLARLFAIDALFRERDQLADLDDRILRDIGVTRADVGAALRRPDEHLRLILLRGRHQFEH